MKKQNFQTLLLMLIAALVMAITGCSGGDGATITPTSQGNKLVIDGTVEMPKSTSKTVAAAVLPTNTVSVYDVSTGLKIGGPVNVNSGKFTGLDFTLTNSKNTVVYVADVAGGPLRYILPLDLSNPPQGLTNNALSIEIGQNSTNKAGAVEAELGIASPAYLGDGTTKTTADFATISDLVVKYAGQVLSFSSTGLKLSGAASNASLIPARNASTFSYADLQDIKLEAEIINAFIPSNKPVINFIIKDKASGKGVTGLRTINLLIAQLVPENNGSNSYWKNYTITDSTKYGKRPNFDPITTFNADGTLKANGYSIIDHGDGTYTAILATDVKNVPNVVYDATLTHRVGITVQSVAVPGVVGKTAGAYSGPLNPATGMASPNFSTLGVATAVYDFIPATGAKQPALAREIVTTEACNQCHYQLGLFFGHAGRRPDVRICVMCHTPQLSSVPDNGDSKGDFTTLMHKIHMGDKLAAVESAYGINFNSIKFPQDVRNCTVCHKGVDGDNWKTKPSQKSCGSCHNNISFEATVPTGMVAHFAGAFADDSVCNSCHGSAAISSIHPEALATTADASKRTMSATIKSAAVDSATGNVSVIFTVSDAGVAVTDSTKFTKPSFSLAKLVPKSNGSSDWVSYTSRFRTKDAAKAPVLQGSNENAGTLVANTDGSFTYTFKLITAEPEGDIRNVTHAHNVSTVAGDYNSTTGLPQYLATANIPNVVSYEPNNTHRIAMSFQKVGTTNVDNLTNAFFDFVPAGGTVKVMRNIVVMDNCNKCHAGKKLHSGYAIEYCVTCHNSSTFDPFTGETVDLQRFVHKLHAGKNLQSVLEGGTYKINGSNHDYTALSYPAPLKNCAMCHVEGAGAPSNAANWYKLPTKAACNTCHDGTAATAHINSNINNEAELCIICHGDTKAANVKASHRWW